MVHPKPANPSRQALYGWLIGRPYDAAALPEVVRAFEAFKRDPSAPVPDVPFQMLTALPLTREHWAAIGEKAGWHMLRMNLNTFARHGVFEVDGFAERVAARLRDPEAIRRARVFPYQLMAAYAMTGTGVPAVVREALQDAMEVAVGNVPALAGPGGDLPRRVGVDELPGHRLPGRRDHGGALASTSPRWWRRRCCGPTGRPG